MKSLFFSILSIFLLCSQLPAQNIKIGEWRSHLSYTSPIKSVEVKNRIYTATEYGLYYFDKDDNAMRTLSKIDNFYDTRIKTIAYDQINDLFMIVYHSTYIDVLQGNRLFSIQDIYRKRLVGRKEVNSIYFHNKKAYIACSFGIVVYDSERDEISETYSEIGSGGTQPDILYVSIFNDSIFAATVDGILTASLQSPNLMDYRSWSYLNTKKTTKLQQFSNNLFAEIDGYIYHYKGGKWEVFIDSLENKCVALEASRDNLFYVYDKGVIYFDKNLNSTVHLENSLKSVLIDLDGNLWLTVAFFGLLQKTSSGYKYYIPNGPSGSRAWNITVANNITWVAPGGLDIQGAPTYNSDGIYYYQEGRWFNVNMRNNAEFAAWRDIVKLAVEPVSKHLYIGAYGKGLGEFHNGKFIKVYDANNSSLQGTISDPNNINISGLCFDEDNNLWISNYGASDALSVKRADQSWQSFNLGGTNRNLGDLIVDDAGRKWIILPRDGGIIVFDENQSQGANYRKLSKAEGNGNLPTERIHAIAKDLKGRIWIGSEEGVAVFYNPADAFSGSRMDAQKIWISDGDESGYLLASEIVTAIKVDGANNKWIGSRNGVWYVSEDGTKILLHFNVRNSPLPSNFIRDIGINQNTGEVFFATDNGIISYRNEAIMGTNQHGDVYAFPNPVRPDYEGPIAIRGLHANANVKITDVAGNVVTDITASGGQAVWDGNDISGRPVRSGVYLVFSTNADGSETMITKILVVR